MKNLTIASLMALLVLTYCQPKKNTSNQEAVEEKPSIEEKIDFAQSMAFAKLSLEKSIRDSYDSSIYMSMDCDDCVEPIRVSGKWILANFELSEYSFADETITVLEELLQQEDAEVIGAVIEVDGVLTPWGQIFLPDQKLPEELLDSDIFVFSPTGEARMGEIGNLFCQFGTSKGSYTWCQCVLKECPEIGRSVCQECPPAIPSMSSRDAYLEWLAFDPVFDPVPWESELFKDAKVSDPEIKQTKQ